MPQISAQEGPSTTVRIYERDKAEFDALVWKLSEQAKRPVTQGQVLRWLLDTAVRADQVEEDLFALVADIFGVHYDNRHSTDEETCDDPLCKHARRVEARYKQNQERKQ